MRVRLTSEPDNAVCLESPFDRDFVDQLKRAIDYGGRKWDPDRKRWIITALYVDVLLQFLQRHGVHVQDDRTPATSMAPLPPVPEDLREAFDALYLTYNAPLCAAEAVFRSLSKYYHPDHDGDPEQFHKVNDAIAVVRHYLDPRPENPDADAVPF
jgi:hypothetical protein